MFEVSSAMTIVLNVLYLSNTISYQGFLTTEFDFHRVLKLPSLAKSEIHISSLQLELETCPFAKFDEIIGASVTDSFFAGPAFFHSLPISFRAATALSSINPSGFRATLSMKLQNMLLSVQY